MNANSEVIMFYSKEELLIEIGNTLDQLIQNAKAVQICDKATCKTELSLLQRAQESLLAKFMHTQDYLIDSYEEVHCSITLLEKIQKLHELSPSLVKDFSKQLSKTPSVGLRPRIGRNRKKLKACKIAYCQL